MIEEGGAPPPALRAIIMGPLLLAVHLEPFLGRADAPERLERPAQVQALVRPARDDEGRDLDRLEVERLRAPVIVDQRMGLDVRPGVFGAVEREADAVGRAGQEAGFRDAAMISEFAIPVGEALPGIERGQRGRPQRRDQILDGGEIGDAGHADLAVRPRLRRQPADRVEAILGFLEAVMVEVPFRLPGAARVDDGDGIAARTPMDRIRSLERRQRRQPFRVHARSRPEDLVRQRMLAVGTPGEQQRQVGLAGGALRPVEIGIDAECRRATGWRGCARSPGRARGESRRRAGAAAACSARSPGRRRAA